jgi:protein-S-isoprenylcysteine O-methyltransferase Ste14
MMYIALGVAGFAIIHLFDVVAIKRIPWAKPVTWSLGSLVFIYAVVMACLSAEKIGLPTAAVIGGWLLLPGALALLLYSLFVNLPFGKTYIKDGVGDELVTTGFYAIVRHPGLYGFVLTMISLVLLSQSQTMLWAALAWTAMDIILIVMQDRVFFGRMFPGYAAYRKTTPMLIPSWQSLASITTNFKLTKLTVRRDQSVSQLSELFSQGKYEEVWKRCCGFIDLSLDDFMRIQKRLLLEQLELFKKCKLGEHILDGASPDNLEEFRETVPLTTYADYAPYLLKRRMDVLPRKPLLWQYTSGKAGEYLYRWVPVTARLVDEIESLMFALMFFSSCKKRGEINFHKGDKVLYGMAPPPYATGTMTRAFPNELFTVLPPVEEAEQVSFEERMKKGFEMGLSEGMDGCIAMSSVAVAIGQRFSQQSKEKTDIKALLKKNPRTVARLAKGMLKARLAHRALLPRDLWNLKSLITFGIDNSVFREKIKDMWGRYSLDFHGCTEAMIIAMQTWDYEGMTFVPHLNFFEFITEKDALRSREDENFKPRTLLLDELVPGNYELVITSFHGGPFMRYRLGLRFTRYVMKNLT